MKYRRRPIEVDAVQYTGDNLEEVRTICPGVHEVDGGWALGIPIPKERQITGVTKTYLTAQRGDFVVRFKTDVVMPMKPTQFEEIYEAA